MTMLDAAIRYASLGLSVVPLRGKIPMFDNWPLIATASPDQITKWWKQTPNANIGIVTGAKSGVFVVDIDPRHGGQESLEQVWAKYGKFPNTWTDTTGSGGTHYYFRYPAFPVHNKTGLFDGIDIRGDNGQVVAPPSIHPETKKPYVWDGILEPWEDKNGLAEAPIWLLELLQPPARKPSTQIDLKIPKGVQHTTLVSLAGAMRRMGLRSHEIYPTLQTVNQERCQEPGPEENIWKIAQSMDRYQPHERNLYQEASKLWRLARHYEERHKEERNAVQYIDGWTLLHSDLKPPTEIVEDILVNGCTLIAGPPKVGKSWLTLGLALAVANGGKFLSLKHVTAPGRVLYYGLEESQQRTANRLQCLCLEPNQALANIEFAYEIPSMKQGGLTFLESKIQDTAPSLVILDTLMAFVTGDRNARGDIFRQDYQEIKALQDVATRHNTCIAVVHHTNKIGGHGVGAVAGTHGVTAAADSIWTMQRQPDRRAVIEITGRDIEDQSLLVELELREPVGWFIVEQGEEVELSIERQEIIELLSAEGALKPRKIAELLKKNAVTIRRLLQKMLQRGSLLVRSDGHYYVPQRYPGESFSDD